MVLSFAALAVLFPIEVVIGGIIVASHLFPMTENLNVNDHTFVDGATYVIRKDVH